MLAGADGIVDIALFGRRKVELLRRLGPFRDGTSVHDHHSGILAGFDASQFQRCSVALLAALTGTPEGAE